MSVGVATGSNCDDHKSVSNTVYLNAVNAGDGGIHIGNVGTGQNSLSGNCESGGSKADASTSIKLDIPTGSVLQNLVVYE